MILSPRSTARFTRKKTCRFRKACARTSPTRSIHQATWCTPTSHRCTSCTTTLRRSSMPPTTRATASDFLRQTRQPLGRAMQRTDVSAMHDFRGMPCPASACILERLLCAQRRTSLPDHPGIVMKANRLAVALASLLLCSAPAFAAAPPSSASSSAQTSASDQSESLIQKLSKPLSSTTTGTVTVEGKAISYEAVAGTLVLDGTGVNEGTPQV